MNIEFEVKFLNITSNSLCEKLLELGATNTKEQTLMRRRTFDLPNKSEYKQWVRVRDEGDKINITLKRVSNSTTIDGTKELELSINNFDTACQFLTECGFIPRSYQENYRENWVLNDTVLSIDTWPALQPFLEIEGNNADSVYLVAKDLGLDNQTKYFGAVDEIYEQLLGISKTAFNQISELTFDNAAEILSNFAIQPISTR